MILASLLCWPHKRRPGSADPGLANLPLVPARRVDSDTPFPFGESVCLRGPIFLLMCGFSRKKMNL